MHIVHLKSDDHLLGGSVDRRGDGREQNLSFHVAHLAVLDNVTDDTNGSYCSDHGNGITEEFPTKLRYLLRDGALYLRNNSAWLK